MVYVNMIYIYSIHTYTSVYILPVLQGGLRRCGLTPACGSAQVRNGRGCTGMQLEADSATNSTAEGCNKKTI